MKIEKAAVIGAGAMGSGIAQVLSQAGIQVVLKDVKDEFVERGLANIKRMYDSRVKREALTADEAERLFKNIKGTTSFEDIGSPDIVIEAALEEIEVKLEIFKELDKICPSHTLLATNTSALSVSEIAGATKRAGKVLGMHFFNPAQTMPLVEVIPGVETAKETIDTAMALVKELGKEPVHVEECPGFLVNRVLFPYMNEALWALQEKKAGPAEIDAKVVEFGMPMGPLALFDMTGIDICAHVVNFLYEEYGPRFEPSPLLKVMVEEGFLGQKSGAGFFVHDKANPVKKGEAKPVNPELDRLIEKANKLAEPGKAKRDFEAERVILPMFNEAVYALQEGVVKACDVDVAMKYGCGLKRGLLSLASDKGLSDCLARLESYHGNLGERFRPAWLMKKLVRAGARDFSTSKKETVCVN